MIVQPGDSLGKIAPKFGVGICDIAKASGIANPNALTPWQTLTTPRPTATPDDTSSLSRQHHHQRRQDAWPAAQTDSSSRRPVCRQRLAAKFPNITLNSFAAAKPKTLAAAGNGSAEALKATTAGSTTGQILAGNLGIDRLYWEVGQTFTLPSDCENLTAMRRTLP